MRFGFRSGPARSGDQSKVRKAKKAKEAKEAKKAKKARRWPELGPIFRAQIHLKKNCQSLCDGKVVSSKSMIVSRKLEDKTVIVDLCRLK